MTDDDIVKVAELDRENLPCWAILHFEQLIKGSHTFHFIIRRPQQDTPCGFICGNLIKGEAEIHKIMVSKKHQRQGLATALIRHTLNHLTSQQCKVCFLELRATNTPALTLYTTFGFQVIGRRNSYYSSPPEDATIMSMRLTS